MSPEPGSEPVPATLRDALLRAVSGGADRLAFAHRGEQLSFAELLERASARGAALQAMGVGRQDRVAIAMSQGLPLAEIFWAAQVIGAVPAIFNPAVPPETLKRRVGRVRPATVVTDEVAADMSLGGTRLTETELTADDLAFLQPTSGTTGASRASMVSQRAVTFYAGTSVDPMPWAPDDVSVAWAPPWHDLGLVWHLIVPLWHEIPCYLVTPAVGTIPEWLRTISEVGGTWSGAPDFAYRIASRVVDPASVDLSSLKGSINGGEPVLRTTVERFESTFSVPGALIPGYGLGEASLGVTVRIPGEPFVVDDRGNVACGRPLPDFEVRAGSSADEPDEIVVRGEALFAGYFEAPEETSRVLVDGWLHTGDMGYLDAESRLFVLGRRSGMIKRAGGLIAPRELEDAALEVAGVRVAAAVSLPDVTRPGEETIVVAVEVGAERPEDEVAADVSRAIVAAVGFAPGRVAIVPRRSIPRTENGKIRHRVLADALLGMQ